MAMTLCPQCSGEMSSYALSCPHCRKMNPAAPQAILLQEKRENLSVVLLKTPDPLPAVESETGRSIKEFSRPDGWTGIQWLEELRIEWNELKPVKKTVLQALFGFAILVGVGLLIFAIAF